MRLKLTLAQDLFYKILGEQTGLTIVDEASLLPCVVELAKARRAYEKIRGALEQVEAGGYGIVMPGLEELKLEEPQIVRQGGQYGVRLCASAPSLHIMRATIHTELSPTVGSEEQERSSSATCSKTLKATPASCGGRTSSAKVSTSWSTKGCRPSCCTCRSRRAAPADNARAHHQRRLRRG